MVVNHFFFQQSNHKLLHYKFPDSCNGQEIFCLLLLNLYIQIYVQSSLVLSLSVLDYLERPSLYVFFHIQFNHKQILFHCSLLKHFQLIRMHIRHILWTTLNQHQKLNHMWIVSKFSSHLIQTWLRSTW